MWSDIVEEEPGFDGSNKNKRAWLEEHRPVGWREEWDKSEDMSDAIRESSKARKLKRGILYRFFNSQDVIPEEVTKY